MANNRCTYQQVENISVKRNKIIEISVNPDLSKKDLKVFLILLTQLDGYRVPKTFKPEYKDPLNFKIIDIDAMADLLYLTKKDIKKAIDHLYDEGIIEKGSNDTISLGYRFTF